MKCKKCGHSVNVLDKFCGGCGASLSLLGDSPQLSSENSLLDSLSSSLDAELTTMQNELFDQPPQQNKNPVANKSNGVVFADLDSPRKNFFSNFNTIDLLTPKEEVHQIGSFVFNSSHVQTNVLYRERAAQTNLVFWEQMDVVNAFATDHTHPEIEIKPPMIVVFGGMTNGTRMVSLALGYDSVVGTSVSRKLLIDVVGALGRKIVENSGSFSHDDAVAISEQFELADKLGDGEVNRRARSYSAAMNMSVIAHELGHIALGHTLGEQRSSMEISRNQEREADSFAASVASTSPFSDFLVAGGIFWWIILTWVEASAGGGRETTHPYSRDRLMDYIRANREQAGALGLDEDSITDFLP